MKPTTAWTIAIAVSAFVTITKVLEGTNQDRFRQALSAALVACQRLESDEALAGRIRFNRRDIELSVNDRLIASNTQDTYDLIKPQLEIFSQELFGGGAHSIRHNLDPRRLFSRRSVQRSLWCG
jgi:hypothetical protein